MYGANACATTMALPSQQGKTNALGGKEVQGADVLLIDISNE